ncbi:hypothetical protein Nepgr_024257 [Nepenthes gracilis]|uniref:Protein kinase domain-containing protein n=1 Tax=Nepenthes gracilis TaxID=150966 RepID=A0AAD3T4P4_NEPGR|nr:hypothetical protein Nepgr_024257 [Nepenthes gracilis]
MGNSRYVASFCLLFLFILSSSVLAQLSSNQKSAMDNLYELLQNQTLALPWSATADPCSWAGVTCSAGNSTITELSLSNYGLHNSNFLPLVCKIDTLEALDVSKNSLSLIPDGFFKSCENIEGFKLLNFSWNGLSGLLPSFSGFSSLQSLDLSYNLLSGVIQLQLDGLDDLKSLNLSFNKFNGSIPINLGKSNALEQLHLSTNLFEGLIPEELANYSNLTLIDLSNNKLSGNLSSTIGKLLNLEVLLLSSNSLTGEIPSILSNIPTLKRFAANQNRFNGGIPSGITKYLKNLDLSYNYLSESIPNDLLCQPNLQTVDLSYNLLEGPIPKTMSSNLTRLRLGSNFLNGSIPSAICDKLQNLVYLELENNSLGGSIPRGLRSCNSLQLLSLAQNHFNGELPRELGDLRQLQGLVLQANNFIGEFPSEITQLSRLSVLNISWNMINGTIPSSISSLKNLVSLDLQGNNLSGSIPSNIADMNSLMELQLGKNNLRGSIPLMPLKLQYTLNFSNNLFEGTIPQSLQSLRQLEVLDLSNNNFSGKIPDFLTKMDSLTQLLLANNNLSGSVPTFNSRVTVTTKPGNLGLTNLTTTASTASHHKKTSITVLLALVFAAVIAGLLCVVSLLLSRRCCRKNNGEVQSRDDPPSPYLMEGYVLTANGIYRSAINFNKAMEVVSNPLNILLKTRFSTYFEAVMPSGARYFIKKLNWSDKIFQPGSLENFGQEIKVLGKLHNANIMAPLAYMLTTDSAYLFYEFAYEGSLCDVLHSSSGTTLDWASRYCIATGVARGLAFLHGCPSGPILLFDLSSRSILLKSITEPQIGDIELYKVIDPSKSTGSISAVAGSVGYIPPEYAYTMRITMAGNVYSFGVILLELLTGKPAVSEGTELAKWVLSKSAHQQLQHRDHLLDFRLKTSPAAKTQMLVMLEIALACVSFSPEARPTMKSVLWRLLNARFASVGELRIAFSILSSFPSGPYGSSQRTADKVLYCFSLCAILNLD